MEWHQDDPKRHTHNLESMSIWHESQHSSKKISDDTFSFNAEYHHIYWNIIFLTWATPSSQPLITSPFPILNLKGLLRSRDESNFFPSVNVPIYVDYIVYVVLYNYLSLIKLEDYLINYYFMFTIKWVLIYHVLVNILV